MPQTADYTYDREADCFVVMDGAGNELCRMKSPHESWHKTFISIVAMHLNDGSLIFPTTGDTKPTHVR